MVYEPKEEIYRELFHPSSFINDDLKCKTLRWLCSVDVALSCSLGVRQQVTMVGDNLLSLLIERPSRNAEGGKGDCAQIRLMHYDQNTENIDGDELWRPFKSNYIEFIHI